MERAKLKSKLKVAAGLGACVLSVTATAQTSSWSYQQIADALHAIIESDRTVYTRLIVNRLQNEEKVIKATEHWKDDKTLVLPAQMLRYGAEGVAEKNPGFSYALLSLWPINKQNAAKTPIEKKGLEAVAKDGSKPFYAEETLGGKKFFTAVYADKAVARACITCHNDHKDTPRRDFKMSETMGGVVVRLPMR
jgi:hypothetical protein